MTKAVISMLLTFKAKNYDLECSLKKETKGKRK
jgi:hypothetical protein